jgi:hypothetical protein
VVVEIINHGEPIPADVLPFIFEPFRRAPQQKRSKGGNLGLGLYIANQIVGSGGGKLLAYSADGKTTFLMRLPRHPPTGDHSQGGPPSDSDDDTVTRTPLRGKEDGASVRRTSTADGSGRPCRRGDRSLRLRKQIFGVGRLPSGKHSSAPTPACA